MSSVKENLQKIRATLPENVTLACVSKFHSAEAILQAYSSGERVFAESRVQELMPKAAALPKDISWHFIGHLQRNKVRQIAPIVALIHSVDSLALLEEISRQGERISKKINILLQVHIAKEEQKFGFSFDEIREFSYEFLSEKFSFVKVCGLMGMATFSDDKSLIMSEFVSLKTLFEEMKKSSFSASNDFEILSMGMSDDYEIAIEQGSNLVRIGSSIFGKRI